MSLSTEPRIGAVRARAYRIPTDRPEADGTLEWRATTLVLAEIEAGPVTGLGYSYTDASAARLIAGTLGEALHGQVLSDHPAMLAGMWRAVRNLGLAGLAATAISALDIALWDARAKWLDLPLAWLLGRARERVEIYGSGGFTSDDLATLSTQLEGWRREGIRACKFKIGTRDANDMTRLRTARDALGPEGELFVDANGAYAPRVALGFAEAAAAFDLRWFEEPVSSEDLDGPRGVRDGVAGRCEIAAGEYAWLPDDFRRLLASGAIDVLQAEATRCGGISGFLAEAYHGDRSAHCAPALHRHVACALPRVRHIEWFHDHARIEQLLFGRPAGRALAGLVAAGLAGTTGEVALLHFRGAFQHRARASLVAACVKVICHETDDTCHLAGTARVGADPAASVVDADCRSWEIPNRWICDGSVFPTVGGVNPSLTIQAIACRTADRVRALDARGEAGSRARSSTSR